MKKSSLLTTMCATALFFITMPSHATLVSRLGGQAYYDTVLNITWLADANLAASNSFGVSGINPNGSMNWNTAHDWIIAMNADGGKGYLGFKDWRLPTNTPVNGMNYNYTFSTDGSTDFGYNNSAPNSAYPGNTSSEMAYMYYNNLGGIAYYDINGNETGCFANSACRTSDGPFSNLVPNYYWTGIDRGEGILGPVAAVFRFNMGGQDQVYQSDKHFVWPVRSGDVADLSIFIEIPGGTTQECTTIGGSNVIMIGNVKVGDPNEIVAITWYLDQNSTPIASGDTAEIFIPFGTHSVQVTVETVTLGSSSWTEIINIEDTIAPRINASFLDPKTGTEIISVNKNTSVEISESVIDICDPAPTITSVVGFKTHEGDILGIKNNKKDASISITSGPETNTVTLEVIAEDASGNMSKDSAVLIITP